MDYKRIRTEFPMTQSHLAAAAGITVRTLRKLENGERVSPETVLAVNAVLDIRTPARSTGSDDTTRRNTVVSRTPPRQGWPFDPIESFPDYKIVKLLMVLLLVIGLAICCVLMAIGIMQMISIQSLSGSGIYMTIIPLVVAITGIFLAWQMECFIPFCDSWTLNFDTFRTPAEVAERMKDIWPMFPKGWDAQVVLTERANGSFVYHLDMAGSPKGDEWTDEDYKITRNKIADAMLSPS